MILPCDKYTIRHQETDYQISQYINIGMDGRKLARSHLCWGKCVNVLAAQLGISVHTGSVSA